MQEDKVDQKKLLLKEQMLTLMYGEAQKNYETFKFLNESVNPGLELLESSFSPIEPIEKSILIFTIIGFVFGATISFIFFYFKKSLQHRII